MVKYSIMTNSPSLCQCGCGKFAPFVVKTDLGKGIRKGEPRRFIYGHHFKTGDRIGRWNMLSPVERFLAKVTKTDTCWLWNAGQTGEGYGSFDQKRAHCVAYELFVGPIAHGLFVCHHCDTPLCVRPDHLFLGTPKDNTQDALKKNRLSTKPPILATINAAKTHCIHGHPLSGENMRIVKSTGERVCRTCARERCNKSIERRVALGRNAS